MINCSVGGSILLDVVKQSRVLPVWYVLLDSFQCDDVIHCCVGRSTLLDIDKQSGVLNVWYMLLDGLAVTALSCHRSSNQLETLTTLFQLLRSAADVPGEV